MKKSVLLSSFLLLTLVFSVQVFAASTLKSFKGTVQVQKAGTQDWVPAQKGMSLELGDRVKTWDKSRAKIDLGKATINLSEKTEFSVKEQTVEGNKRTTRSNLAIGHLRAKVDKMKPGSTFEITTPTSVAAVRGTIFDLFVFLLNGELITKLIVDDGTVNFSDLNGNKNVDVEEDEQSSGDKDGVNDPVDEDGDDDDDNEDEGIGGDTFDKDSFGSQQEDAPEEEQKDDSPKDEKTNRDNW